MVETALKTKRQRRLRRASQTEACSDAAPFPPLPSASNLRALGVKRQAELNAEGAEVPHHPKPSTTTHQAPSHVVHCQGTSRIKLFQKPVPGPISIALS